MERDESLGLEARQVQKIATDIQNDQSLADISYLPSSSFMGHGPFLRYLIRETSPSLFVELGTDKGFSYFTACQAFSDFKIPGLCFAVDDWIGDVHVGLHPVEVFDQVSSRNQKYQEFSTLLKMDFDEALSRFNDESIELLIIDGTHTYEAVKKDFENWLPKMSQNGVILFHDIHVRIKPFGVIRLWEEIKAKFSSLEFVNQYGLGVIFLDGTKSLALNDLIKIASGENWNDVEAAFAFHGSKVVDSLQGQHSELQGQHSELQGQHSELQGQHSELQGQHSELQGQHNQILESEVWKLTFPLRKVLHFLRR